MLPLEEACDAQYEDRATQMRDCAGKLTNCQHHHLDNHLLNFNFGLRFVKVSIITVQNSFLEVKSYGIA